MGREPPLAERRTHVVGLPLALSVRLRHRRREPQHLLGVRPRPGRLARPLGKGHALVQPVLLQVRGAREGLRRASARKPSRRASRAPSPEPAQASRRAPAQRAAHLAMHPPAVLPCHGRDPLDLQLPKVCGVCGHVKDPRPSWELQRERGHNDPLPFGEQRRLRPKGRTSTTTALQVGALPVFGAPPPGCPIDEGLELYRRPPASGPARSRPREGRRSPPHA